VYGGGNRPDLAHNRRRGATCRWRSRAGGAPAKRPPTGPAGRRTRPELPVQPARDGQPGVLFRGTGAANAARPYLATPPATGRSGTGVLRMRRARVQPSGKEVQRRRTRPEPGPFSVIRRRAAAAVSVYTPPANRVGCRPARELATKRRLDVRARVNAPAFNEPWPPRS